MSKISAGLSAHFYDEDIHLPVVIVPNDELYYIGAGSMEKNRMIRNRIGSFRMSDDIFDWITENDFKFYPLDNKNSTCYLLVGSEADVALFNLRWH